MNEEVEQPIKTIISDNVFYGVKWNKKATQGINDVAKALLNLTELYKSQNIVINSLLTVQTEQKTNDVIKPNLESNDE